MRKLLPLFKSNGKSKDIKIVKDLIQNILPVALILKDINWLQTDADFYLAGPL